MSRGAGTVQTRSTRCALESPNFHRYPRDHKQHLVRRSSKALIRPAQDVAIVACGSRRGYDSQADLIRDHKKLEPSLRCHIEDLFYLGCDIRLERRCGDIIQASGACERDETVRNEQCEAVEDCGLSILRSG